MYQTKHLRNERCPECAKLGRDRHGDNLGVYSDGSCFCWACGYRKSGNAISAVKRPQSDREDTPAVVLPSDVDTYLPAVARQWLGSYALSEHDFIRNRLLWSEQRQLLVFPYFDKYHNLVAWQGRNFEKDSKWPKWFSKGDLKTLYHILPIKETYSGSVVVVEDIVSAIKVGATRLRRELRLVSALQQRPPGRQPHLRPGPRRRRPQGLSGF